MRAKDDAYITTGSGEPEDKGYKVEATKWLDETSLTLSYTFKVFDPEGKERQSVRVPRDMLYDRGEYNPLKPLLRSAAEFSLSTLDKVLDKVVVDEPTMYNEKIFKQISYAELYHLIFEQIKMKYSKEPYTGEQRYIYVPEELLLIEIGTLLRMYGAEFTEILQWALEHGYLRTDTLRGYTYTILEGDDSEKYKRVYALGIISSVDIRRLRLEELSK
jgi:hypothetical protein